MTSPSCVPAVRASGKEIATTCSTRPRRWTPSCPRTRKRPPTRTEQHSPSEANARPLADGRQQMEGGRAGSDQPRGRELEGHLERDLTLDEAVHLV
jgi:hypothetical protein